MSVTEIGTREPPRDDHRQRILSVRNQGRTLPLMRSGLRRDNTAAPAVSHHSSRGSTVDRAASCMAVPFSAQ